MKTYFRLSATLGDGVSQEIADDIDVVCERVRAWCEEFKREGEGFECSIETVLMSEREFNALPDL